MWQGSSRSVVKAVTTASGGKRVTINMDNQALQLVIAMQKSLCDLLSEVNPYSERAIKARHVAEDAARIIKKQGQQPEEVPDYEVM